jgi:AcrR family transcriptional regulator
METDGGPLAETVPAAQARGRSRSSRDFTGARANAEADATLAAIHAAAAAAFRERCFAATSIDDVARRLGATKGLVYHYYRSKDDLFLDVCRRGMELQIAAVQAPASSRERAVTRLRSMAEAHLAALIRHGDFQHAILQAVGRHSSGPASHEGGDGLAEIIDARERYEQLFRRTLAEAVAQGGCIAHRQGVPVGAERAGLLVSRTSERDGSGAPRARPRTCPVRSQGRRGERCHHRRGVRAMIETAPWDRSDDISRRDDGPFPERLADPARCGGTSITGDMP